MASSSSVTASDLGELRKRLQASNAFFKAAVDLVPPAFYFDKDVTQQLSEERSKQLESKLKGGGKGDLSEKARLKRARFDPTENKTVSELASCMVAEQSTDRSYDAAHSDLRPSQKTRLTLEELRDKLHQRIEELRGKRHAVTADEFLEKKKLRRKESKVKLKIRKKAEKESQSQVKQAKNEASKSTVGASGGAVVAPAESKLAFSKFEFSSEAAKARPKAGQKNFKDLLRKAEREQEALSQLKATDASKASELEAQRLWTVAIDKAKGVKVRNDPALIKKSIKLQEKKKEKSRKEWQSRVESVEHRMKERQEKRQKNIQARKHGKMDKKVKRLKSKGRLISGF